MESETPALEAYEAGQLAAIIEADGTLIMFTESTDEPAWLAYCAKVIRWRADVSRE